MLDMSQVREFRVLNSAAFDWVATFTVAYLLLTMFPQRVFGTLRISHPVQWYALMIPLAYVAHVAFRVRTPVVQAIESTNWNIFKAIMFTSILLIIFAPFF